MQVVDRPIQAPGICFICQHSNDVRYVDTTRNFDPVGPSPVRGRIYVCENCVNDFAKAFGFLSPAEAQSVRDEAERARVEAEAARAEADVAKAIELGFKRLEFIRTGANAPLNTPTPEAVRVAEQSVPNPVVDEAFEPVVEEFDGEGKRPKTRKPKAA
jgi:hypothetical protein